MTLAMCVLYCMCAKLLILNITVRVQATINQQKRKISRQRDILSNLKGRYLETDRKYMEVGMCVCKCKTFHSCVQI